MIFNQPVVYELGEIKMPTLLLIGQLDTTAIGKDFAPPQVASSLGNYAQLGRIAASRIPKCRLIEFPDAGHAPQIQNPNAFSRALIEGLEAQHQSQNSLR
jgi:pimeloyl-ACP methyl ester carboxylesterase